MLIADCPSEEQIEVKLADFGSAAQLKSSDDTEDFRIGTPGYIAPEILQAKRYGKSIDIFSLGVLLHLLLTANFPFWDDNASVRKQKVCNEPLDLEKNPASAKLSQNLKVLLYGMLERDP